MRAARESSAQRGTPRRSLALSANRDMPKEEHIKGAADKAKGAVKEAAGKMTGDKQMQAEGKMDKAKGAAHEAGGDAKDAVRSTQKS
jgi:uncharacterized protein YjbJ (UPF0337 family)